MGDPPKVRQKNSLLLLGNWQNNVPFVSKFKTKRSTMNNTTLRFSLLLIITALLAACASNEENTTVEEEKPTPVTIETAPFGTLDDGTAIDLYTLTNANGLIVKITNYGGIVTSIIAPDKDGKLEDIALGFDSLQPYLDGHPYFGALIGRYGNRIAKGTFSIDDETYSLATNNGENHLHGGIQGFDKVVWQAQSMSSDSSASLQLTYRSPDMEEGYPGNLDVTVVYTLTNADELHISYEATTDKKTIVNLTNHTYFNLTGNTKQDILEHELLLQADTYLPVDETLIPTGERRPVADTPFDFTEPTAIGARIDADNKQLEIAGGYDHCWIANGSGMRLIARAQDPASGRTVEVHTEEPGVQFYSGNFLDGSLTGKGGTVYEQRYGFCLETQHFPDSPNQPDFPSVVLEPGEEYQTKTIYTFGVQ